jgi:hypothetical protein
MNADPHNIDSEDKVLDSEKVLEVVKEQEEEDVKAEDEEKEKRRSMFTKHRVNKYKGYENFDNRKSIMHDIADFSWDFHAIDLFSTYLPELAEAMNIEMKYAF